MRKDEKNNSMKDSELEALVSKLAPKKGAGLDQNFKRGLNFRLHSEISQLNMEKQTKQSFNFNPMKKFNYILAGGVAVAIVALIFITLPDDKNNVLLPGKQQITRVGEKAFGSLATLTTSGGGMGENNTASATQDSAKLSSPTAPSMAVGMGGGGTMSSDLKMFAPVNYKFVYAGDEFTIDSDKMPVYERQKGFGGSVSLSSLLGGFNVNSVNIGKFGDANVDYVTATQDVDHGYTLNLDLREGNIYIGQNWQRWVTAASSCVDQSCYDANRLSIDQVPDNDAVIAVANQFLDEYGIDKSNFGEPIVQDNWRIDYANYPDKSNYYIPDSVSIIYPIKIEGNETYDQGGNKSGMYVTVDIRSSKVSGVGELNSQRYQASDYETEQDTKRIIGIAEKGGYQTYYPLAAESGPDSNVDVEEVSLGNPVMGYVRLWLTNNNVTKDVYVPSLIFPVIKASKNVYVKNVIVPVVKEVLDTQSKDVVPPIRILQDKAM